MFYHKISISLVMILFLSFSIGIAADKVEFSESPPAQITKKWRIGYYEGGPYHYYPKTLTAIVEGLADLGWMEPVTIPPQENENDTDKLWAWLSGNIRSKYLEFVGNAYYSCNWDTEHRKKNKQSAVRRLKEGRDIDLMIVMGTWAGQDLVNNEHSVPTIVCGTSDAVTSKIIKSGEDSGYDHVHAHFDPGKYVTQIRAFHDIFGFKRLGVAFENTVDGRSYAAIEDIQKIAGEREFKIVECHISETEPENAVVKCARELAPKIDAFYITLHRSVNKETLPKILAVMNARKIPTFSQSGPSEVRQGVLLSVADPNFKLLGKFHAKAIAKTINGAKPRDLNQILELPLKIAFNEATAKEIDLKDESYQLILKIADEIYNKTERVK